MEPWHSASKRTIERALENVGDRDRLAALLGVSVADLNRWILGKELPPHDVFLRALDLAYRATTPLSVPPKTPELRPSRKNSSSPRPASAPRRGLRLQRVRTSLRPAGLAPAKLAPT